MLHRFCGAITMVSKRRKPSRSRASTKEIDALFALLEAQARRVGWTQATLAEQIGISYPYYISLRTGEKSLANASIEVVRRFAAVIGWPPVRLMVTVGALAWDDFGAPRVSEQSLEGLLEQSYMKLLADPACQSMAPSSPDWDEAPIGMKVSLIAFYEVARRTALRSVSAVHPWMESLIQAIDRR